MLSHEAGLRDPAPALRRYEPGEVDKACEALKRVGQGCAVIEFLQQLEPPVPASTRFLADSAGLGEPGRRTQRACLPDRYPWRRWPPTLLDRSAGLLQRVQHRAAQSWAFHVWSVARCGP